MIRFVYNLLFPVALLFFLPGYARKMIRRGNYRHKFGQRFGIYDTPTRERLRDGGRTWIHAVSVGEVSVALKLIAKMRAADPRFRCVLTTTTSTAFALASKSADRTLEVMYNPIDFWPVMRRAFSVIRPARLVLVEAEVWPNLVAIARARRIPVALINARLSPRSEARFRRFRFFVAPTFRCLDLVCVQEPEDADRWAALGIPRERVRVVGSVKFDTGDVQVRSDAPRQTLQDFGIEAGRPILFGGSTHAGEEEILGEIFQRLRTEFPDLLLIIAPRHVERVPEIRPRLEQLGLAVRLRSETGAPAHAAPDCVLLDTTGELQNWYAVATIVFVGKSLEARGGQNPVEPIVAGKPVLFGPHMENFSKLAQALVEHGAAVTVRDAADLEGQIARLLRDPAAARALVANAQAILASHAGATMRTAELLLALKPARD